MRSLAGYANGRSHFSFELIRHFNGKPSLAESEAEKALRSARASGERNFMNLSTLRNEADHAVLLALNEGEVVAKCLVAKVGIAAIEQLPSGGVRLVCRSSEGAALIAHQLRPHVMGAVRPGKRPTTPLL